MGRAGSDCFLSMVYSAMDLFAVRPVRHTVLDALGFIFKDVDEDMPDDAAFFLRIGDAGQGLQEAITSVDDMQVGMEMIAESAADSFRFSLPQ